MKTKDISQNIMYFMLGNNGTGKDTQAEKMIASYAKIGKPLLVLSTGDEVRAISAMTQSHPELHIPIRLKEINDASALQPPVFAFSLLLTKLIRSYQGTDVLISGSPRSVEEVKAFESIIKVGYVPKAEIIWLEAREEICIQRILDAKREGRADSSSIESIKKKMEWYPEVVKAKEYAIKECSDTFKVSEFNAELPVEEVWEHINNRIFQEQRV